MALSNNDFQPFGQGILAAPQPELGLPSSHNDGFEKDCDKGYAFGLNVHSEEQTHEKSSTSLGSCSDVKSKTDLSLGSYSSGVLPSVYSDPVSQKDLSDIFLSPSERKNIINQEEADDDNESLLDQSFDDED
jgi:hypothetical protein